MPKLTKADLKGIAAQLSHDLDLGDRGGADRAIDALVRGGFTRWEATLWVTDRVQADLIEIARQRL